MLLVSLSASGNCLGKKNVPERCDSRFISAKSLGTWIFVGSRFYKLMGLRYNPKLSIWKLKIVHHWDVSTKSMLERRWFFVDRRIQILAQPGGRPIYELQSIHSAKKRKPDQTVWYRIKRHIWITCDLGKNLWGFKGKIHLLLGVYCSSPCFA